MVKNDEQFDPPVPLCWSCMIPSPVERNFCRGCGMPLTHFSVIAPLEQVYAMGWCCREAASRPSSVIVLCGMIVIFGTGAMAMADFCAAPIIGVLSLIILGKTVLHYVRKPVRPLLQPRCSECARLFSDPGTTQCESCGAQQEYPWLVHPSDIPEEGFPVGCVRCRYSLTGLGPSGRCPECGEEFERAQRLTATYGSGAAPEKLDLGESDDQVNEVDFPIRCSFCRSDLSGVASHASCPECGLAFVRADRLLETYGPEVFADDPEWAKRLPPDDHDPDRARPRVAVLMWFLCMPLVLGLSYSLVGEVDYVVTGGLVAALLGLAFMLRNRRGT